ncbi:Myosin heavy chain-related protein [Striga hermonthica]|uniref:Myosin heavy chain-related protein n=1 Tax=Striga hermonthica TaxID=68872 RepID=A0A9N7RJ16_STRHE|nr:Myosin heavy chain-related protein [Striga hermonthica]
MLRSKTRLDSVDITQKKKNYSSVFSRTLSASKLCRGDVIGTQIDAEALNSKNRAHIMTTMQQQQMGEMEEELRRTKEKFDITKLENKQMLDQLKRAKEEANYIKAAKEALPHNNRADELRAELEHARKLLEASQHESKTKTTMIDSLESEFAKASRVATSFDAMKNELSVSRDSERRANASLHESMKRVQHLQDELERQKASESRMSESLAFQAKELERSKIETVTLRKVIGSLEEKLSAQNSSYNKENSISKGEEEEEENEIARLRIELQSAQKAEKILREEMQVIRNEWRLAIESEEKSAKAMEDLALALKEVATESNRAKEKLESVQAELNHTKLETERLRKMLHEANQEAELHKNTADRLRLEAEETLLTLNAKEMGFVSCIKRAEEERVVAQRENSRLLESLKAAENMTRAAREETYKLRDILKQAVNESNAAKAASGIAREENSLLQDSVSEKDERLHFLTRENERLRMSEAAAHENARQLKILLSRASTEFKSNDHDFDDDDDNDEEEEEKEEEEENLEGKNEYNMDKNFSFNLEDLKFMNEPEGEREVDEDPVKAEALRGSIFDTNAETPKSEPRTPQSARERGMFWVRRSEDFDCSGDSDTERGSHRRVKTMFQRVGGLLTIRRSLHRKETASSPVEQAVATQH